MSRLNYCSMTFCLLWNQSNNQLFISERVRINVESVRDEALSRKIKCSIGKLNLCQYYQETFSNTIFLELKRDNLSKFFENVSTKVRITLNCVKFEKNAATFFSVWHNMQLDHAMLMLVKYKNFTTNQWTERRRQFDWR